MTTLKKAAIGAAIVTAIGSTCLTAAAQSAEQAARQERTVIASVAEASIAWKEAFNAGDAAGATAMYEKDAVMVVDPFGTFTGHDEILGFWTNLVEQGFDDVVYRNTTMVVLDDKSARVSADWSMNKASGVITNELWVIQEDGRALLREDHFAVAPAAEPAEQ